MRLKFLSLFVLLSCFHTLVLADKHELTPSMQLTISDGLPHNGVTCALEDTKGYMWIGTFDGLSRYDGYSFTIIRNTLKDAQLASNRVRSLCEDVHGDIWIGTDEGISLYDYQTETVISIYERTAEKGPVVVDIINDSLNQQIVAITENRRILTFNYEHKLTASYTLSTSIFPKELQFNGGALVSDNLFCLSSAQGLFSFDPRNGQFKHLLSKKIKHCIDVLPFGEAYMFVCGLNGLAVVEYDNHADSVSMKFKHTTYGYEAFRCMNTDNFGNLWLGTYKNGFFKITDTDALLINKKQPFKTFHRETKLIRSSWVLPRKDGSCWVGTFNRGVFTFDNALNPFSSYSSNGLDAYGLESDEILHITPYNWFQVFVSAHSGGVGLFNVKTKEFEPLPFDLPNSLKKRTSSLFSDNRGNIWMRISGDYGICRVRKHHTSIERVLSKDAPAFNKSAVREIVEDQFSQLWFGGEDGLFRVQVNRENNVSRVENLLHHPFFKTKEGLRIRHLYVDSHHNYLWVGTKGSGLYRISTSRNEPITDLEIKHYVDRDGKFLTPSEFVSSVVRLPNDELWIGTERGGIAKLIETDDETKFEVYSEADGLSNNVVKSIQFDEAYNLWITTNIGLNKFNTKDKTFRIIRVSDGLPFEDFTNVGVKMKNGLMVFSGIEGFCFFHPDDINDEEALPQVDLGSFKLFNQLVKPGEVVGKRVLLDKRLNDVEEIILKHNQNVFSFEINSLHFSTPANHSIKYQLLPVNPEWVETTSDKKEIYYNGLPPGDYTFRMKASNSLGKWTDTKELRIIVKRPFWLSIWAFIMYVLFVAGLVWVFIYFMLKIQTLRHNYELEYLEKEKNKEVNAAKLRFFSNISHEIKTPITLISGPVEVLFERFKYHPDVSEKLNIVKRQARKITQLVDQVHDFQRADANQLKMNFTTFKFDDLVQELKEDFGFLAENEGKNLTVDPGVEDTFVKADRDKLSKVLNNLLSNAFKFTSKGDIICIDFYQLESDLIVKVKDNGKGIDSNDLPYIFERFFQSQKMKKEYSGGSGIGLAFSKRLVEMHYGYISADSVEGEGTTITVKMPIITDDLLEDNLEAEQRILSSEKKFVGKQVDEPKSKMSHIVVEDELRACTIFLVEDNTDMRMFVSETLRNFFTVKTFRDGTECLKAMEEEWPDLVVSDVLMPEMNGFELTRAIKSDIKTCHIPVILLTACTVIDDQIKGIREGADAYLLKPFDIEHLVARITTLLKARTKLRQRYEAMLPTQLKKNEDNTKDVIFLEKLYELMNENLSNQSLDLNHFARELYLNRTHFYQKVKALTNQTPFELLKNYRLKKAADLLLNERLPVNEVIVATGFKSRSHFIKSFKECYNTTPGKYAQVVDDSLVDKDKTEE